MRHHHLRGLTGVMLVTALFAATPVSAGLFHRKPAPAPGTVTDASVAQIQKALDESRNVDAARLLDQMIMGGAHDARLDVLSGEVSLTQAHYEDALKSFKAAEASGPVRAKALQGEGIALTLIGRSGEAMAMLQTAVQEDPSQWRAWNALGGEVDRRGDWASAESAYEHALANSNRAASVLNNRGFSRLLQRRLDDAAADFVAALAKKPDLTAARTNLRLTLAMRGDYDRATAGGAVSDRAALLNNAGYAAMMRGDYAQAEDLFNRAMKARGEYYARASENLDRLHAVMSSRPSTIAAPNAANH